MRERKGDPGRGEGGGFMIGPLPTRARPDVSVSRARQSTLQFRTPWWSQQQQQQQKQPPPPSPSQPILLGRREINPPANSPAAVDSGSPPSRLGFGPDPLSLLVLPPYSSVRPSPSSEEEHG
ncbi:hypothetical protein MYCTH_110951 [Thermothelomyces thermophilus ATCC 42464]|uniref:Uncharacterized protein n=1 Tax=Thermothelomyces thermophilus (strain ATCC 42464 / BCRC 31852 / DSM 1799) TaxID=573729 RepID=G2QAY0_THET4|nr:uncharacterized protein MYCTH_110951 [Thermothelomyces thermophilus ATCC 42464]AEO56772.1 hypothetical protein MYCTH_110951 [Thermothelomyces thermophilus ATCC 42464]